MCRVPLTWDMACWLNMGGMASRVHPAGHGWAFGWMVAGVRMDGPLTDGTLITHSHIGHRTLTHWLIKVSTSRGRDNLTTVPPTVELAVVKDVGPWQPRRGAPPPLPPAATPLGGLLHQPRTSGCFSRRKPKRRIWTWDGVTWSQAALFQQQT